MAVSGAISAAIDPLERLSAAPDHLAALCRAWHITELALYGSVLRDDFQAHSDVDVLVTFAPGHTPGMDVIDLVDQLAALFGRPVDLMTRRQLEYGAPTILTEAIRSTARAVYRA